MKSLWKSLSLLCMLMVILIGSLNYVLAETTNLAPNSSFEDGIYSPSGWEPKIAGANVIWSSTEAHSGSRSICLGEINANSSFDYGTILHIPVTPGKTYRIGAWAKGVTDIEGSIGIDPFDNNGKRIIRHVTNINFDETNWGYNEFTIQAQSNWAEVEIVIGLNNPGMFNPNYICFDDVILEEFTGEPPNQNGLNVPLYKQGIYPRNDNYPTWENDLYGASNQNCKTIYDWGCAVTSAAMLLSQQGVDVNPGQLNAWLRSQTDGYKGCFINFVAVARFARENGAPLYYHGKEEPRTEFSDDILNQLLFDSKVPVILHFKNLGGVESHFVVATGLTTINEQQTWSINDPWFDRDNLSAYSYSYSGIRVFSKESAGAQVIGGTNNIDFIVYDPLGRRTGLDPNLGNMVEEIPNSHYLIESIDRDNDQSTEASPPEKIVEIIEPMSGMYTVQVTGIESGPFTIHFFGYDTEQNPTGTKIFDGKISTDTKQNFIVSYSSEPASLFEVSLVVNIDIKPSSEPNCINNDGHGVIPVGILSDNNFDATQVDPITISLDGQKIQFREKGKLLSSIEDINSDGLLDLLVKIPDIDGTYDGDETIAVLTGETYTGFKVIGSDSICIVP